MTGATGLVERLRDHLSCAEWPTKAPAVIVAVSGGLDSMTLLHLLLRVRDVGGLGSAGPETIAAHLDHRMSPGSASTAQWAEDKCAEWGVRCRSEAVPSPPRSEAEARTLRYRFLEETRREAGQEAVVATGHTADDQAETVLFRIARGAGPRGMAGILPERPPGVVRPLLPFWRRELAAYAAAHGVPFREDPTNLDLRWTRNRLRHEVLPALEEAVPGAASALAALAGTSRAQVAALDHLLDDQIASLADIAPHGLHLDHHRLLSLPDPVIALVLRRAVHRLGGHLGRAATRDLLRFAKQSPSGRRIAVPGGVTVTRDLDRIRVHTTHPAPRPTDHPTPPPAHLTHSPTPTHSTASPPQPQPPPPIPIPPTGAGEARYSTPALEVEAAWAPAPPPGFPFVAPFAPEAVRFPLAVRPWRPGDRIEARYGKKKIKKLLLEARIPTDRRTGYPVVADATGKLLWVPGVADPVTAPEQSTPRWLGVRIRASAEHHPSPPPTP